MSTAGRLLKLIGIGVALIDRDSDRGLANAATPSMSGRDASPNGDFATRRISHDS